MAIVLQKAIQLIDRQVEWVEKQFFAEQTIRACPFRKHNATQKQLKWTGNLVDWVELIYALHTIGHINNGKVSLKELFHTLGKLFNFEVKEYSNYFMNIKNRTDGKRTKFLSQLTDALLRKMEDTDRKPSMK